MKNGRMAEQGTFSDLVSRPGGIFRGMWERQQRKEEGEDDNDDEESLVFDAENVEGNKHSDQHHHH